MLKIWFRKTRSLSEICDPAEIFPLCPPLPLPEGVTEKQLFDFVTSIRVHGSPEAEMRTYCEQDFRRFVYTLGLASNVSGKCLELGGNPYFTTMLLKKFTELEISVGNYFGDGNHQNYAQNVDYMDLDGVHKRTERIRFEHFNIEMEVFPYADNEFDLVIMAEIIEHLLMDPARVLREIKRVLKPGGIVIITTPNVARLENVMKLIGGANIYDPYSGYGPYGRHNREYNLHELAGLLRFQGYDPNVCFTADVHVNNAQGFFPIKKIANFLKFRERDLGQYIFVKAVALDTPPENKKPGWLYRSYSADELA